MLKRDKAFQEARERARIIEMALAAYLKRMGHKVLPTYDFSGLQDEKAPRLEAANPAESLVIPDLMATKRGKIRWFEAKLKTQATWTYITQRLETGFNRRHWEHYWKVQAESGCPVWIVFWHEKEREIRAASLNFLDSVKRAYDGHQMGRGGMMFFPYDAIPLIASLDDPEIILALDEARRREAQRSACATP